MFMRGSRDLRKKMWWQHCKWRLLFILIGVILLLLIIGSQSERETERQRQKKKKQSDREDKETSDERNKVVLTRLFLVPLVMKAKK